MNTTENQPNIQQNIQQNIQPNVQQNTQPPFEIDALEMDVLNALKTLVPDSSITATNPKREVLLKRRRLNFLHENILALLTNHTTEVNSIILKWGIEERGMTNLQVVTALSNVYVYYSTQPTKN